ncbi:FAD/NAD(P)-binding domain-containing protein [Lentithecium fluviatile CBS 122367]|uniref:FAD/NAD(P)-binding domain-containing protein n=1 Tax=Lentithecium fluviatile CBS 122367 TaxID=1168545 RepID=A0A6G1JJ44_9PLEO|nr:FAD/NAD(P)-binding domain-containing protein [Lentithecium fluviatile CBS 122367]
MAPLKTKPLAMIAIAFGGIFLSAALRLLIPDLNFFYPVLVDQSEPDADVLILGGGHAGLSGALTLVRHQHDILIFDNGSPRNRWDTPMHVLPTWEHRSPKAFRERSRRELQSTGLVKFVDEKIVKTERKNESLFHVTSSSGKKWSGRKLMVAVGSEFVYPDIPGYGENFPEKILHCLFTRGFEFRGSAAAGIIAADLASSPPHAVILGEDANKFAESVTIYTNGDRSLAEDIRSVLAQKRDSMMQIDPRQITRIAKDPATNGITLQFDDGNNRTESFIVHQPTTKVNGEIVHQLGLEINDRGDIHTRMPFYQTNVSGVFAAGDAASPFKMVPNAVFQGSNAGAGISRELPRRVTGNKVNRLQQGVAARWIGNLL